MDRQYIIDANILILSNRQLYPFDIMPSFWDQLIEKGAEKTVLIDKIKSEIYRGGDELAQWLRENQENFIEKDMNDPEVIAAYTRIIQSVTDNSQYTQAAKDEFAEVADSWLCAHALAHDYVIITQEKRSPESKKRVLIPNVCEEFGIEYIDLLTFLREIQMRIV